MATPLVELTRFARGLPARIFAKVEGASPGGSIKHRIAASLVEAAEGAGLQRKGTLIEATSGNLGLALAPLAAARRYRLVLVLPGHAVEQRKALLEDLGAEVVTTPGALMRDAVARARALHDERPGSFLLGQFESRLNADTHRRTTAEEIWAQTAGAVDALVAGIGTGGTITGIGELLKERRPGVHVAGVEPVAAAVLAKAPRPATDHDLVGIGPGFVPPLLDTAVLDEVVSVTDDEAWVCARRLAREEGILCGLSSGAALAAAMALAGRPAFEGKQIVVVLPDAGERHVTTSLRDELVGGNR